MKKVLIAVDGTRHSQEVVTAFYGLPSVPEEVVLLNVEDPGSGSLMYQMLGETEMNTLRESLKETEFKKARDRQADAILAYYEKQLNPNGRTYVKGILREGNPSEEILKAADDEEAEMIILGFSGRKGLDRLISGSVTARVRKESRVPVLLAKKISLCEEPYTWKDAYEAIFFCSAIVAAMVFFGFVFQDQSFLP